MWLLICILSCLGFQDVVSDVLPSFPVESDIVHPIRVDEHGSFLTFDLSPRYIKKRGLSLPTPYDVYYEIRYQGADLVFNLSQNVELLAPGFVSEWRSGGIKEARIQRKTSSSCHMRGDVQTQQQFMGIAAISVCNGLNGIFQLEQEDLLIEPLAVTKPLPGEAMPHRIYRRDAGESRTQTQTGHMSCGMRDQHSQEKWDRRRARWEQLQLREHKERRIRTRSISKEKWVETLVVADHKMVEYHGSDNVENYVLTVMNMEDLKITHHADNTLRSFCKWQKNLNMKGEEHPQHHDVAVLLTRKDICAAMNRPCETLGLSHVSGMCQPHRSCNINEDTGLPTAFTVTHELGHSFGVQHDGSGNDCEPRGKRPHIMSPQLLYDTSPLTWSHCSRDYITRFLDRGWGLCLDDPPSKELLDFPSVPPGVLYDVAHQCRLQYGSSSSFCRDIDNVCNTLWCSVGSTCHSKLDAAVDGTNCGHNKWCFNGNCVPVGQRPAPVDGSWGSWSSWSSCTRSCGAGVQNAERHCTNPMPKYGGRYCLGERKRFRVCNILPCPSDTPSFRHLQCSRFDSVPYKGKLLQWTPVLSSINPCELHCQSETKLIAEKLLDAVIDGTPCFEGNTSRDMCINGICKNVGCDYEIDSNAVEDRCGVCHGDDSTCHTVQKTFDDSDGLGYVDIGLIPPGAREIRIEEVAEAGNFLALRSEDPEKYFLNGMWTIQWNGDYPVAGTTFTYTRTGNLENLTAPGPTYEPVWIQLLFQESNPGVRYQYTVRRDQDNSNEIPLPEFSWRYGTWTECSATCGIGVQRQMVHCVEKMAGLVEERYCDTLTRPDDRQRSCNEDPCPPRWWVGDWQQCSVTCGLGGLQKRTVLCIQRVGLDEQRALQPADCQHLLRPETSIPCNHHHPCPEVWQQGNWSQCSVSCGEGVQFRDVYCNNSTEGSICDPSNRPLDRRACILAACPVDPFYKHFDWTGSGATNRNIFNDIFPGRPRSPSNPQHHGDENSISERDFTNPGDGGQGKGGNAFVDDFYYDYNFINFHEDLTYDPLENNYIHLDGQGENPVKELPTKPSHYDYDRKDERQNEESTQSEAPSSVITTKSLDLFTSSIDHNLSSSTIFSSTTQQETKDIFSELVTISTYLSTEPITGEELSPKDKKHIEDDETIYQKNVESLTKLATDKSLLVTSYKPILRGLPDIFVQDTATHPLDVLPKDQLPSSSPYTPQNLLNYITQQPTSDMSVSSAQTYSLYHSSDELSPGSTIYPVYDFSESIVTNLPLYPISDTSPALEKDDSKLTVSDLLPKTEQNNSLATPDTTRDPLGEQTVSRLPVQNQNITHDTTDDISLTPKGTVSLGEVETPLLLDISAENIAVDTSQDLTTNSKWRFSSSTESEISSDSKVSYPQPSSATPVHSLFTASTTLKSTVVTDHFDVNLYTSKTTSSITRVSVSSHLDPKAKDRGTPVNPNKRYKTAIPGPPITNNSWHLPGSQNNQWDVGNWSECSTSCGLGAMWRSIRCRVNETETCNLNTMPAPARRCYLRPCASWTVGNWSKCSQSCGNGVKVRDVHCLDMRDKRVLRPFHCQNTVYKPREQIPCREQQCMEWYVSSWRECSEECGGGMQERLVTCPQMGLCNENLKPNGTRSCNDHPCTKWAVGPWGQCTASCGGGIQRRQVKCINIHTGAAEEDNSLCDHEPWPENLQKCNPQDCQQSQNNVSCIRDRLTFSFCRTLKILGRCSLLTVQAQCCHTCQSNILGSRELNNQRLSRR
uniref:ADAM metallopeptidase with thrombospondin type 1 motif 7 n=1 Tax=Xenopus tropicalis TaxID=8364 RepID=A0A6I8SLL5_XENTR